MGAGDAGTVERCSGGEGPRVDTREMEGEPTVATGVRTGTGRPGAGSALFFLENIWVDPMITIIVRCSLGLVDPRILLVEAPH